MISQPSMAEANSIIREYSNTAMRLLKLQMPYMSTQEIAVAVDYSIRKRMKDGEMYVQNNYLNTKVNTTALEMANYILDQEPIITAAGVMFKKHAETINPLYNLINEFIDQRKIYKKEMFKYPKGSPEFAKYNLLQLLEKLNANAQYRVAWLVKVMCSPRN